MCSFDRDTGECVSADDETDFKSDTMFDSIRTGGSTRRRAVETPLDSMFDDTPPSTASNTMPGRLSIQEMLGRSLEVDNDKITEEEESIPTPVRTARSSTHRLALVTGAKIESGPYSLDAAPPTVAFDPSGYTRPSFDDEDDNGDEDHDNDGFLNHLSTPYGSLSRKKANASLRTALATISGNIMSDVHSDTATERPRSSVFDWTEPVVNGKEDGDGHSPRPSTVHGKHEIDLRGGRGCSWRPTASHVRSQSVPVVSDQPENPKSTPKFGTWATSKHVISEDWDEDFDFGESVNEYRGDTKADPSLSMVIPSSIQASQPSIKAHTGQIREFSLLVNDLKRLCRRFRDQN